ncbi:MAG TPA: hypothetical protein VF799_13055 [Geobacteraceae bacterium]
MRIDNYGRARRFLTHLNYYRLVACWLPFEQDHATHTFKPGTTFDPHVPDAWIDHSKTRVGYEIPLNRHFYVYQPPKELSDIEADIRVIEKEIVAMLAEVMA